MATNTRISPLSFATWVFVSSTFLISYPTKGYCLVRPFWALEKSMAEFMVGKTQAFSFMVFLFFLIKLRWGFWRWTHPWLGFPNLPQLFPFSHMGMGIRGINFCPRRSIHVFEWFPISFILSLKVYGFNLWVYS